MVEKRGRLPVGLLIAAPPIVAALYFASLWLPYKLTNWHPPVILLVPVAWFFEAVLEPVVDTLGWDLHAYDVDGWAFAGILCLAWSVAFLSVGLLLGGLAALVNLFWRSGGSGDQGE